MGKAFKNKDNRTLANKADAVSGNRVQFLCEDAVGFKIADNVDRFSFSIHFLLRYSRAFWRIL